MRALEAIHPGWGITAVRVMMAIVVMVAGYQKLTGGIGGVAVFFGSAGIPAPDIMAPFIVALELLGGILLLIGLGTRWLGLLYVAEFLVASFVVVLPRSGWSAGRLELMLVAAGLTFFLAGGGKASVDEFLAKRREHAGEPAAA